MLLHAENDVQKSTTTKSSEEGESSSSDDSEEEDSLGKVLTKAGMEIDRKSAGNVKRSKEEAKADEEPENEFGYTDSECLPRITNWNRNNSWRYFFFLNFHFKKVSFIFWRLAKRHVC